MKQYGIDNSKQERSLTSNDFKIYKNTYSIASASAPTMNRVLNMSRKYLDTSIIGYGDVYKLLRSQNYNVGIAMPDSYFYKGKVPKLDFYLPEDITDEFEVLKNSIKQGEFASMQTEHLNRIILWKKEKNIYL